MSVPCPWCSTPIAIDDGTICTGCGGVVDTDLDGVRPVPGIAARAAVTRSERASSPTLTASLEAALRGRDEWQRKALEAVREIDTQAALAGRKARDAAYDRAARVADTEAESTDDPRMSEIARRVARAIRNMRGQIE